MVSSSRMGPEGGYSVRVGSFIQKSKHRALFSGKTLSSGTSAKSVRWKLLCDRGGLVAGTSLACLSQLRCRIRWRTYLLGLVRGTPSNARGTNVARQSSISLKLVNNCDTTSRGSSSSGMEKRGPVSNRTLQNGQRWFAAHPIPHLSSAKVRNSL